MRLSSVLAKLLCGRETDENSSKVKTTTENISILWAIVSHGPQPQHGFGQRVNDLPAQTSVEHVRLTRLFRKSYSEQIILIAGILNHCLSDAWRSGHLHDVLRAR